MHTLDMEPNKAKYRCHWTPPLAIDPFDPATVYYGCQVIFKTSNAGQTWKVISPDLSTNDPSHVVSSGGIIGDNLGQFYGEVVFAIAPSEIQKGLIWAGTNDGKVWNTTDGGVKWKDVTNNVTGMAPWGTIRKIEPSRFEPQTAYMVVDYHMMDDRKPYIYKTTDLGKSWKRISDGLPQDHPLSYALSVAENPNRKGMLFAGTGNSMYYTLDDGAHMEAAAHRPSCGAGHLDRGRQARARRGRLDVRPRDLRDARYHAAGASRTRSPRERRCTSTRRAPGCATPAAAAPTSRIRSPQRRRIRYAWSSSIRPVQRCARSKYRGAPGASRITWDLRYDPPKEPSLRTTPPDNPHIWDEPRYKNKTTRQIVHWGIQQPQRTGPLAAAGRYTVRLTVDGQVVHAAADDHEGSRRSRRAWPTCRPPPGRRHAFATTSTRPA